MCSPWLDFSKLLLSEKDHNCAVYWKTLNLSFFDYVVAQCPSAVIFFFSRTPLHCAAANNATDLTRFLIEHGACILAVTTLEKKTPLQCCERGQPGYFNCTRYLNGKRQEYWNYGIRGSGVAIFPFEIILTYPL